MRRTSALLLCLCWAAQTLAQQPASPAQMWDQRYAAAEFVYGVEPVEFLKAQIGRLGKGRAELYKSSIEGFSGYFPMPPRGGNPNLTDEEVRAAVDYLLDQAGLH